MHLVIDGYRGDAAKMWDKQRLETFLLELPSTLGMTRITEPTVLDYHAPKPEDSGISGFVIIAESHISVHTFPHKSYVNIDIFSCQTFNKEEALANAKSLFDLEEVQTWVLDRGLEWLDAREGALGTRQQRAELEKGLAGV